RRAVPLNGRTGLSASKHVVASTDEGRDDDEHRNVIERELRPHNYHCIAHRGKGERDWRLGWALSSDRSEPSRGIHRCLVKACHRVVRTVKLLTAQEILDEKHLQKM